MTSGIFDALASIGPPIYRGAGDPDPRLEDRVPLTDGELGLEIEPLHDLSWGRCL